MIFLVTLTKKCASGAYPTAVSPRWQPAAIIVFGVLAFTLIFTLVLGSSLDPADPNVRLSPAGLQTREIDRAMRKHVIENSQCYYCQVRVGKRSKHCRACNKCVSDFDHHCIWSVVE